MSETLESSFVPKDLDADTLKAMREKVHDKIIVARVGLLLRHPFFGNMATRLGIKDCDDWCPTAATDGRNLYFNTQFFNELSNKEIEFVIAHEIMHCVFDHLIRREDRNPMLYNIAADYIVNNTLIREKIGSLPTLIPCFHDFKYSGWTSEEVYEDLKKEQEEKGEQALKELGELLDDHVDWEKSDGGDSSEGETTRPSYTKEELKQIRDEIKENVMSAAQAAGAGNTPSEVERMIKELTEPKMNWREILKQQVQSTLKNDFTFVRPSRRGWHTGAVLPGMQNDETIEICVGLDVSGSISDTMLKDFLSEVKGIMEEYKDYNIKIWCFDTEVSGEDDFSADDGRDLLDYEITGGGGTNFMANWEYMQEQGIEPKKFIMFTDGYPWAEWGDPDYCDTIFVVHGDKNRSITAPFGLTVYYE